MRKLLLAVSVVALMLLPMGCDVDIEGMVRDVVDEILDDMTTTYTIKVISGVGVNATGLNVTGEYTVVSVEFDPDTDSMDFVSQSYPVSHTEIAAGEHIEFTVDDALAVSAMFQKKTGDETALTAEIREGEVLVDSEETVEPWGAVLVTAFP